ncbi:MAG: hypothetical protein V3U20_11550, partial [Thermoplasmata archaeon]
DDLYAYWVNTTGGTYQIEGNFSTDLGVTWSQTKGFTANTETKRYLTSVYYATDVYWTGWHWTKVVAGDNEVLFERIPEFQDIIVPIFCTIIMAVIWKRRRKKH